MLCLYSTTGLDSPVIKTALHWKIYGIAANSEVHAYVTQDYNIFLPRKLLLILLHNMSFECEHNFLYYFEECI